MFERLFKRAFAIARHASAPYADERARYLTHCLERGEKPTTVRRKAYELLRVAHRCKRRYPDLRLTQQQVEHVTRNCKARGRVALASRTRRERVQTARSWLRFLGSFKRPSIPFAAQLQAYCDWAREERGFSEVTIAGTYEQVKQFLLWFADRERPLSSVRIGDVDAYLAYGASERGWSSLSVRNVANSLRAFFRYGAVTGWTPEGLPALIRGPRVYALEGLPQGPNWHDVERLLGSVDLRRHKDVRDHAILMLLAIYGLRRCEVARLCLQDIDWERDLLHVPRAKGVRRQTYPLLPSVGNAILKYVRTVRPATSERTLFLTFTTPPRPVQPFTLYKGVASRLTALGVQLPHRGPHCLRHACATHLLGSGVSMKAIGDHLGHVSAYATRTYAKVDLPGLRRVADFDLGALS